MAWSLKVQDTFNASVALSSHTPDTGATWVKDSAAAGDINTLTGSPNILTSGTSGSSLYIYHVPTTLAADEAVECVVGDHNNFFGNNSGLMVRFGVSGGNASGYLFHVDAFGNTLYKFSGTGFGVTSIATGTQSAANGVNVRMEIVGSAITCLIAGSTTNVASATDSTYASAGFVGLSMEGNTGTGWAATFNGYDQAGGGGSRGLFLNDLMTGTGVGGSFFRNPLQRQAA